MFVRLSNPFIKYINVTMRFTNIGRSRKVLLQHVVVFSQRFAEINHLANESLKLCPDVE